MSSKLLPRVFCFSPENTMKSPSQIQLAVPVTVPSAQSEAQLQSTDPRSYGRVRRDGNRSFTQFIRQRKPPRGNKEETGAFLLRQQHVLGHQVMASNVILVTFGGRAMHWAWPPEGGARPWNASGRDGRTPTAWLAHLHDKLPASRKAPLSEQQVLRLLLLLRLLDLGQSADRVHPLAILRAAL